MAQSFLIGGNKIPNKSHAYFCSPPIPRARRLTPRFNELGPDGKRMNKSFWQKGAGEVDCLQARFTRKLFLPLPHALVVNSAMSPRWRCLIADDLFQQPGGLGGGMEASMHETAATLWYQTKGGFGSCSLQDGFTPRGCCDVVTPKRFQRLWRLKILSQEQWSILINTTLGYIQRSPAAARHLILIPLYLILIWINRSSQFPLWRSASCQKNNCVVHFIRHISPHDEVS